MGTVKVTEEIILSGQSIFGGWSKPQLELIGVSWPPQSGWKPRVIGKEFNRGVIDEFIELKDAHLV